MGRCHEYMPWEFYLHYGDLDMLAYTYDGMKEYISYMLTWTDDTGVMYSQRAGTNGQPIRWLNLGDWAQPFELPLTTWSILSTCGDALILLQKQQKHSEMLKRQRNTQLLPGR
jgi:hypothetical protein